VNALVVKDRKKRARVQYPLVRFHGECDWELAKEYRLNGYTAPKGLRFDGASIPRVFWWWYDPSGAAFPAAIIHDYHYTYQPISRRSADGAFYKNLLAIGVRPAAAWLMWLGVRLFGGRAWKRHKAHADERKGYRHQPHNLD
jgi:hypothetical protein